MLYGAAGVENLNRRSRKIEKESSIIFWKAEKADSLAILHMWRIKYSLISWWKSKTNQIGQSICLLDARANGNEISAKIAYVREILMDSEYLEKRLSLWKFQPYILEYIFNFWSKSQLSLKVLSIV